jgi:hypothetical protein
MRVTFFLPALPQGLAITTPQTRPAKGDNQMRKFHFSYLASALLGVFLTTTAVTHEASARGFSRGGGGFHSAAHFSAPRRASAPRHAFISHAHTARRFNNSHAFSHSHSNVSHGGGGHAIHANHLVSPAGHGSVAGHHGLGHVGHLRPAHHLGFYRPARWIGGALLIGAGDYYYNSLGLPMLPGADGVPFDLEDYVRSLPDDGMLAADDPAYLMMDTSQDGRQWTAASMAPDFQYKSAAKYQSKEEAQQDALAGCQAKSQVPDKCATVSSQQWVAGVSCEADMDGGEPSKRSVVSQGVNAKAAISNAYGAALKDDTFRKDDCKVRVLSAANGDQSKFSDSK